MACRIAALNNLLLNMADVNFNDREDVLTNLRDQINEYMKLMKPTAEQVENATGISKTTQWRISTGKTEPKFSQASLWLRFLGHPLYCNSKPM